MPSTRRKQQRARPDPIQQPLKPPPIRPVPALPLPIDGDINQAHPIIHNPSIIRNTYAFLPCVDQCTLLRVDKVLFELVGKLIYRHITVYSGLDPLIGIDQIERKGTKRQKALYNTKRRLISFVQYLHIDTFAYDRKALDKTIDHLFSVRDTDLSNISTVSVSSVWCHEFRKIMYWRADTWTPTRIILSLLRCTESCCSGDTYSTTSLPDSVRHVVFQWPPHTERQNYAFPSECAITQTCISAAHITRITLVCDSSRAKQLLGVVIRVLRETEKMIDMVYADDGMEDKPGCRPRMVKCLEVRDEVWLRMQLEAEARRVGWEDERVQSRIEGLMIVPRGEVDGEEWDKYVSG